MQLRALAQVELARGELLGTGILEVGRDDLAVVDPHQSAADHRIDGRLAQIRLAQELPKRLDILGLDVDQKVIRRTFGQSLLPGREQIDAHHGQQQQGQDAEPQAGDLQDRCRGSSRQGREPESPDTAGTSGETAGETHQDEDRDHQARDRAEHAGHQLPGQLEIIRLPNNQERQGRRGTEHRQDGRAARSTQIATQRTQRRDLCQLKQGRKCKAQECNQTRRHADEDGCEGGRRQIRREPIRQQAHQPELPKPAEQTAHQTGDQTEERQPHHEDPHQQVIGRTQTTHHGDCVGLAFDEATAGQRDRRPGDQQGDERGQMQETRSAIHRGLELGSGGAAVDQVDIDRQTRFDIPFEPLDRRSLPGDQETMLGPARLGDQPGRREVRLAQHDPRCQRKERTATVRLVAQDGAHTQTRLAETHLVAERRAEQGQETRLDPDLAGRRPSLDLAIRRIEGIADAQASAQGISGVDGLHLDELRPALAHHDTAKLDDFRAG